jgi:hypothetical protein
MSLIMLILMLYLQKKKWLSILLLAVRIELHLQICLPASHQLVDFLLIPHEDERWGCAYIELRNQFLGVGETFSIEVSV